MLIGDLYRLSEDPSIRVGVIEAGTVHSDDPLVDTPSQAPLQKLLEEC